VVPTDSANVVEQVRARFRQNSTIKDAIELHAVAPVEALTMRVIQWHSSRVFAPLTGWHGKFRPNTACEGLQLFLTIGQHWP
jgi:hypothetical protein